VKFLAIVKAWWAAHLTLIIGVVAFLFPSVQQYAASHPGQAFAGILMLVVGAILSPNRPVATSTQTETTTQVVTEVPTKVAAAKR